MLETAMIAAFGALSTALVVLALLPFVRIRAEKLAMRKLEWRLPSSPAEIAAERDRLRAEVAVRERQAEQKIEVMEAARLNDQTEVGRRLIDLHARSEEITLLNGTISDRDREIDRLTGEGNDKSARIADLTSALASSEAHGVSQGSTIDGLRFDLDASMRLAEDRRVEIEALEAMRQAHLLRIGDTETDLRRTQSSLADKTDEARGLDRKLRDTASTLETVSAARQRADELAAERQTTLKAKEATLQQLTAERNRLVVELSNESKTRRSLEDEIDRRAKQAAQLENELAAVRKAGIQTATELTVRTGELGAERQARKSAEQSARDMTRRADAADKKLITATQARENSDSSRVAALERELKTAMKREADLQKLLEQTRREAQETARDLSRTINQLKQEKTARQAAAPSSAPVASLSTVGTTVRPRAPAANGDRPQANGEDPRGSIAEMRDRLRRKLEDDTRAAASPIEPLREMRRDTEQRALPPGE